MPTTLHLKIVELQSKGYSYSQIVNELKCSLSTVSYYLGKGQKQKTYIRRKKFGLKQHPYWKKIEHFTEVKVKSKIDKKQSSSTKKLLYNKVLDFARKRNSNMPQFTPEDVINKFGENPVCYLTGKEIDIYSPRTYQFDHKIPVSKGGDNSLENLGIATSQANKCKHDLTPEELIQFCKDVLTNHGYNVERKLQESNL